LDKRVNEMVVLMTARHWTQQFEWYAHKPKALAAGLKSDIIDAIAECRRPDVMAADEAAAYDLVTEVFANQSASDRTYAAALKQFDEARVIEILGLVGYYGMLAIVMNVARTGLPDGQQPQL